jgi:hypothetical protein
VDPETVFAPYEHSLRQLTARERGARSDFDQIGLVALSYCWAVSTDTGWSVWRYSSLLSSGERHMKHFSSGLA